jgi:hypothetical protein
MNGFDSSLSLKGLFKGENKKPTLILLLAPIIIITWKCFGTKAFYLAHLSSFSLFNNPDWTGATYSYLTGLLLFFLLPVLLIKLVFCEPLASYGVQIGDKKFGWLAVAVMAPVMILIHSFLRSIHCSKVRGHPRLHSSSMHFCT